MFLKYLIIYISLISLCSGFFELVAPIGTGLASIAVGMVCTFRECCTEKYIPVNLDELEIALGAKVYGQHLVSEIVLNSLYSHWKSQIKPQKPLTLSFHGWPGSGKNYVTQFIASSLFKEGMKSKFVHQFIGRVHFSREDKVRQYQMDLYDWISGNVSNCPRQLFIFDEVDKMPAGVLNILKPLIDYREHIEGVDYREAIFIFLSNTGAIDINKRYLELWETEGIKRENLRLKHFEDLITKGAFNEEGSWYNALRSIIFSHFPSAFYYLWWLPGGFFHSDTIKSNLIDHFVPFLPMERQHIKLCIMDQFKTRNITNPTEYQMEEALEFIEWGPSHNPIFSKTGCKRLSQKVGIIAARYRN